MSLTHRLMVFLLTISLLVCMRPGCASSDGPPSADAGTVTQDAIELGTEPGAVAAETDRLADLDEARGEAGREPEPFSTFTNSIGMKFVLLPPGTFLMGSPPDELGRSLYETQHEVTLTKPFYMGITEVTQPQYEAVMGVNPSRFPGDRTPVQNVSWYDAAAFCEKLSELEGRRYRLPTEAEWEYACRASTATPFAFGETISADQDNFDGRVVYGEGKRGVFRARPVAADGMKPNRWGIISMHGNVKEWCADWYEQDTYGNQPRIDPTGPAAGRLRVLRGGGYSSHPQYCRSAHRFGASPNHRFMNIGFRVVCDMFEIEED